MSKPNPTVRNSSRNSRRNIQQSPVTGNEHVGTKDSRGTDTGSKDNVRQTGHAKEVSGISNGNTGLANTSAQGHSKGQPAIWIALEGIDGCGKSTQVERVAQHFDATKFRFPTDPCVIVEALETSHPVERMLIFMADMVETSTMIRAIKRDGGMVITDRSAISSYAYQATKSIHGTYSSTALYDMIKVPSLIPDLVIYLKVPLQEAERRIMERSKKGVEIHEFEKHDKLARTYAQMESIVKVVETKVVTVDATQPMEQVTAAIIKAIKEYEHEG